MEEKDQNPIGLTVYSGRECPETGIWMVAGQGKESFTPIKKGCSMPSYNGNSRSWALISTKVDDILKILMDN